MEHFTWHLIEFNLYLILFYLIYFLLKQRLSFKVQRGILVGTPILAFALLYFKSYLLSSDFVYQINLITLQEAVQVPNAETETIFSTQYLTAQNFYLLGLLLFGSLFLFRLGKIIYFFASNAHTKDGAYRIYTIPGHDSFSFFNNIQLNNSILQEEQQIILEHEKLHHKKMHSLEMLIFEIYHVFTWFNPLVYFAKKELIDLHEYEVDHELYQKYNANYLQFLLAYTLGTSSTSYLLTNQFYNPLTLKKRITKMKIKTKNKHVTLLIFPLLALTLGFTQCTEEEVTPTTESTATIATSLDEEPTYKGGDEALVQAIISQVEYPKACVEKNIEGTVYVKYTVLTSGDIENVHVARGVHEKMDAEAVRVTKTLNNWNPGIKDGQPVKAEMVLPIKFAL